MTLLQLPLDTPTFVYVIQNNINNKYYVGITTRSVKKRWNVHKRVTGVKSLINKAIIKYGKENFTVTTICKTNLEFALFLEKKFIKELNSFGKGGYNCTEGGETPPSNRGNKMSDATKAILKKSLLGHTRAQGERSGMAKLKEEDVIYILNNPTIPLKELADKFNCSKCCIQDIYSGRSWGHIDRLQFTGRYKGRTKKLSVDGIVYESRNEYLKTNNICTSTLYKRLKREPEKCFYLKIEEYYK